ncbi:MAG: DUF2461 domain-containing protein [Flavobacteriaceae bacterium]|nr:DUF2461 domain-containing protein [Flavobacteriaceae bacterium]MCY4266668.1 DUF2461 domain-containing protein [Flavobacteriaceae bacterium]
MPRVSPSIFEFLETLKQNNHREWFHAHKQVYKERRALVTEYAQYILEGLNISDDIEKFKVFHIHIDVRFKKDKTPYKTHFSFFYVRKKPKLRGGYYVHLSPNSSFIAGGFWKPEKDDLLRIRQEFEMDGQKFRDFSLDPKFKKVWGHLYGTEVKTAPKGFSKEHQNIDLIRKKQLIFRSPLSDQQVFSKSFLDDVVRRFELIRPFFDYMSDILTTDLNGESIL